MRMTLVALLALLGCSSLYIGPATAAFNGATPILSLDRFADADEEGEEEDAPEEDAESCGLACYPPPV